jgi:hypothetical protein
VRFPAKLYELFGRIESLAVTTGKCDMRIPDLDVFDVSCF